MDHPSAADQSSIDYSIPGMRIQLCKPPHPWPVIVKTAAEQPWAIHPEDRFAAAFHVDTAIEYQNKNYFVARAEQTEAGWVYYFQDWPDGEPRLKVVELNASALAQNAIEQHQDSTILKRAHSSTQYEILLGWLPSPVQERLSERLHFSPREATRKNGLLAFFIGLGLSITLMLLGSGFCFFFSFSRLMGRSAGRSPLPVNAPAAC